jgi:hypothetical protein
MFVAFLAGFRKHIALESSTSTTKQACVGTQIGLGRGLQNERDLAMVKDLPRKWW